MPTLTINGKCLALDCEPETPLLWAIREGAGLSGTRPGCLVGLCGACTVHLDGQPVRACCKSVAQAEGRAVTTIEGMLETPVGRALRAAWAAGAVGGCDQCRPGRIMAAAALLARCGEPSDEEAEAALAAHACDCGEIAAAGEALRRAARQARAATANRAEEQTGVAAVDLKSAASASDQLERTTR